MGRFSLVKASLVAFGPGLKYPGQVTLLSQAIVGTQPLNRLFSFKLLSAPQAEVPLSIWDLQPLVIASYVSLQLSAKVSSGLAAMPVRRAAHIPGGR
jgi:hypothetical protein